MSDPMNSPPVDYGSDRWGYIELTTPDDKPDLLPCGDWWEELIDNPPCPDCNANLFLTYQNGDPSVRNSWAVTFAHDDPCPWLTAHEKA